MGNSLNSLVFQPPPPTYSKTSHNIRFITSGTDTIAIDVRKSGENKEKKILVLYSHGNAEDLGQQGGFLTNFTTELGRHISCVVASYDYSGYGKSSGTTSEQTVFQNASDVLTTLLFEEKISYDRVVLWGRSLGSGPTCHLAHLAAKQNNPVQAIILESPLLSIYRVGLRSTHWVTLPGDLFRNYEKILDGGFGEDTKMFIIHGKSDTVVPFSHGQTLNGVIPEKNRHPPLFVENAGHNNVHVKVQQQYGKDVDQFVIDFISKTFEQS